MDRQVLIASSDSPARLVLSEFNLPDTEGWYSFTATLEHDGLSATARVEDNTVRSLPVFFEDMARDWRGWQGEKTWFAGEGQLYLSATSDRFGHVFLTAELVPGWHDTWKTTVRFRLDVAQRQPIADQLRSHLACLQRR